MLKVLIVEDEDIIRKGLVYTINWLEMNCSVIGAAQNGAEGLEMIRSLSPDLVLTDIRMPRMDGLEMVKKAQESNFFKVILLTSYSEFEYAKQAISLQVSDYLLKPVDEENLKQVIARIQQQVHTHHSFATMVEKSKAAPISELECWDIYQSLGGQHNQYVQRAVAEIAARYCEKITIEMLAEELGISSSYLSRKFKEVFGKTYLEVLNQYRIQQSIALLRKGTYLIYEVSCMCGFSEYKYFCSVFKKYTGMSPSQFMKNCSHIVLSDQN